MKGASRRGSKTVHQIEPVGASPAPLVDSVADPYAQRLAW